MRKIIIALMGASLMSGCAHAQDNPHKTAPKHTSSFAKMHSEYRVYNADIDAMAIGIECNMREYFS